MAGRVLPRRHRGLLRPAHLRDHRRPAGPPRAPPRRRGHLRAPGRSHGQAQHHRCVPALGLPRPRLEPGRHLATGAGDRDRSGPHLPAASPVPRSHPGAGGAPPPRHPRQRRPAVGVGPHRDRRARAPQRPPPRHGRQRPRVDGDHRASRALVAAGARTRRAPRPRRRAWCSMAPRAGLPRTSAGSAPGCARSASDRGSPASTGSGCSSRARTTAPPGWPSPRPRPRSWRATWSWRARPGSTSCGSTPTSPDPSSTTAADEAGLLLWQDLPLQWGYARGIRKQAVQQATAAVDLLGHHPSIALWCGHNEPMAIENDPSMWAEPEGPPPDGPEGGGRAGAPDVEQDGARPVAEASAREGRRHPPRDPPQRRAPPPTPARRHRQPPLLRLVPRPRARLPWLPPCAPADGPLRHRVRSPGGARQRRLLRTRPLARPRLGAARPHPCAPASAVRPPCAAGRPRHLRRVAHGDAGVPGRGRAPAHRGAASHQVPAHRWVRPVLLRRRPPGGDVVGARARSAAQGGLRRAARGLPAGDRRRRPPSRGHHHRSGARPRRARGERSADPGRRRRGDGAPRLDGRQSHLAVARRHPCRRVPARRHRADRRARRAGTHRARARVPARRHAGRQPLRRDGRSADSSGSPGQE